MTRRTPPASGSGRAPGARDQVARLLTLVPFLHQRDGVRLAEAAALLDTTPEQVLRDLRVLFMCGLPGGLPDDLIDVDLDAIQTEQGSPLSDGVIRVANADYLSRPLRLSATEASAVIVALRTLRDTSTGQTREVVDSALAKLERAVTTAGAGHVAVNPSPRDADQVRLAELTAVLEQAIDAGRQVRLSYFVASRNEESERVVDPVAVLTHGAHSYLDAWCHRAGGDRLFRLDRIVKAEVLDDPVEVRRVPRDLSAGLFRDPGLEGAVLVTLRLDRQARWATEYYPVRAVRGLPDGGAEVDLVVLDRRWLNRLLLRLAPHARVVSPPEVAASFTALASETLGLYR
ncbi:WYL domain-containing protein [Nocardioides sp. zg-ZUI104]|uniref:helix-turn-helix transcriptional regulator n=1 Tax=Nocardioides faecalis TaxID=2803858 RepID=UPI001BD08D2F|nr:WYL domain-containing protein [Nocardioides faecalis]MBS4753831.1 WYL domain-containing protein [Nocardioides faecalis]